MSDRQSRRLPSSSQYKAVIEDPRDLQIASVAGVADIRTGWFRHDDGQPLWFAECRWRKGNYQVMEYGDTRDEAFRRAMSHLKTGGAA